MKKIQFLITLLFALNLTSPEISFAQGTRVWASYYGGTGEEIAFSNATDAAGNVYVAGWTNSTTGIATPGCFKNTLSKGTTGCPLCIATYDIFLVKFDAAGNRLWGTYYGDTTNEYNPNIATDAQGNVYLCAYTTGASNIASPGAYQTTIGGGDDAFLVKFDSNGNRLWATYYGGTSGDRGMNVATDTKGNVYMGGTTGSSTGIATPGAYRTTPEGGGDAFLVKFDTNGNRIWGTYYGGSKSESGSHWGCATDLSDNVYLAGVTKSDTGISTTGSFQSTFVGGIILPFNIPANDDFLVKFDKDGKRLWATYYGDDGDETAASCATDAKGNVYLAGETSSTKNIAWGGYQNTYGGGSYVSDEFLVKFDSTGSRQWATYYGGNDWEEDGKVTTGTSGKVYLTGSSYSANGIGYNGFQDTIGGFENAFVAAFNSDGTLQCATYYNYNSHDEETYSAADGFGNIYLTSNTHGTTGYSYNGFQNNFGGGSWDAFLVKLGPCANTIPHAYFTASDTVFCEGGGCINFFDSSSGNPIGWKWLFPGASPNFSNVQNPISICYNNAGTYPVTLIVTNAAGTDTLTVSPMITVSSGAIPPVVTISNDTNFSSHGATYQWNLNGFPIPGATDSFYVCSQAGTYSVRVTDSIGCSALSNGVYNSCLTGLNELTPESEQLIVYPNPNEGLFSFYFPSALAGQNVLLKINNVLGQEVYSCPIPHVRDKNIFAFELKTEPGVYLLQITDEKRVYSGKIIIK